MKFRVSLLWVALVLAMPHLASRGANPGGASTTVGRLSDTSGKVSYFRAEIQCRAPDPNEARYLGAVLSGAEAETLYPEAVSLTPLVNMGADGYVLTVATRAFSTSLVRGGGDFLLMGLTTDFAPQWATVFGGPAPDGPLSLTRTRDGGIAVVGTTKSSYTSSVLRFLKSSPEAVLVSKHAPDGQLLWARLLAPGELGIANPIVAPSDAGLVVGGTVWRDSRWAGFVLRMDDDGRLLWGHLLGRDHEVGVTWLVPTSDGGVLASGPRQRVARPGVKLLDLKFEIWLAHLRADGSPLWSKSYALDSGLAGVIAAPLRQRQGWLVVREPRYDRGTDTSRFPVFEVDAAGEVQWAAEYALEGDGRVTTVLPSDSDGYLLFGPASPKEATGGTFTIELGPEGQVRSSTWIDVASAISTGSVQAVMSNDPVAAVREANGGYVIMGDYMSLPQESVANAKPGSRPPPDLREKLKSGVFLLRAESDGRVAGCSLPLRVSSKPLTLKAEDFDLAPSGLPASAVTELPAGRLDIRRLESR